MKNYSLKNAVFIAFLALLMPIFKVNAQISITETRPSDMTVCLGDYTFSLTILNTSTTQPITSMQVMVDLPDYVLYSAGSVVNASEVNPDPSNPVFGVANIPVLDSVVVSYQLHAGCDILQNIIDQVVIQNSYGFTYFSGATFVSQPPILQQSYNLNYPNLSITISDNGIPANCFVGENYNYGSTIYRTVTIINDSEGATDLVTVRIKPEPEVVFNGFLAYDGITQLPFVFDGMNNEYIITIAGSNLDACSANSGPDPDLFENGENIRFYEDFTVVACSPFPNPLNYYKLEWGCNAQVCNDIVGIGDATTNSSVFVPTSNADFDIFIGSNQNLLNFGNDGTMEFYYVNTGTTNGDFAQNIILDMYSYEEIGGTYQLPVSFELFDYAINGVPINPLFITPSSAIPWTAPMSSTTTPGYIIDLTQNQTMGMGLQDLDGDTYLDDLAAGDTIKLTVKVRFNNTTEFDTECPLRMEQNYGFSKIEWQTACGIGKQSIDGSTWHYNRYNAYIFPDAQSLVDPITEPSDFVEGIPETFTFCTGSWYYQMSALDCPVNAYQAIIHLPLGYHLYGDSSTWFSTFGDSITYLATEVGTDVIINGGGTSNMPGHQNDWTGCFDVDLILLCPDSGTIPSVSDISWEFRYQCDSSTTFQRRACSSDDVYNHVLTCGDGECMGILTEGFDLERTTLGWTDATRTVHVTNATPGINLNAAYVYDEVQSTTAGQVFDDGMDNVFVEIRYTAAEALFNFLNGTFYIFDSGGSPAGSCVSSAPVQTVAGGDYIYTFQMPCFGSLSDGDSIAFVANWEIANSNIIQHTRDYTIQDFRSRFLTEYNDTLSQCDSWGDPFN